MMFLKIRYLLKVRRAMLELLLLILIKKQSMIWLKKLLLRGEIDQLNSQKLKRLQNEQNKPVYIIDSDNDENLSDSLTVSSKN